MKRRVSQKVVPALFNLLGTLILLFVLAAALAVTVPRLMGYQVYHIVSGSMEPEIPIGSVVFVSPTKPEDASQGDVVAFWRNEAVITHRVVDNRVVEGEIRTKGDANEGEDPSPVHYSDFIGTVSRHVPYIGAVLVLFNSTVGKVYVVAFAACGAMLNILAGRIRQRAKDDAQAVDYE